MKTHFKQQPLFGYGDTNDKTEESKVSVALKKKQQNKRRRSESCEKVVHKRKKDSGITHHDDWRAPHFKSQTLYIPPNGILESIQYSFLAPEDVKKLSVCEINNPYLYKQHVVQRNSLNDAAMGPSDAFMSCSSCHADNDVCAGHFAKTELSVPLFNVEVLSKLLVILRCICFNCCRCLVHKSHPAYHNLQNIVSCKKRLIAISKAVHGIKYCGQQPSCGKLVEEPNTTYPVDDDDDTPPVVTDDLLSASEQQHYGCNFVQPTYRKDNGIFIRANFPITGDEESTQFPIFDTQTIINMLKMVPEEDYAFLGINSKETQLSDALFTTLPVCPPSVRPSVTHAIGSHVKGQDDLTRSYKKLLLPNTEIRSRLKGVVSTPSLLSSSSSGVVTQTEDDPTIPFKQLHPFSLAQYVHGDFHHEDPRIVYEYARRCKAVTAQSTTSNSQPLLLPPHPVVCSPFTPKYTRVGNNRSLADLFIELQVAVAGLQHSDLGAEYNVGKTHTAKPKGIHQRYKGKFGRFRNDQLGKRGDETARTVLSPDPNIGIGQVGLPKMFCQQLSRRETVRIDNIIELTELVRNRSVRYLWSVKPLVQGGELIDCEEEDGSAAPSELLNDLSLLSDELLKNLVLRRGYIIERPLMNGDITVVNRQPTLHKNGIMSHEVVELPFDTIRMNPSCLPPYNGDCDGDEVNLYDVKKVEAQSEAEFLMASGRHIISGAANKPIISFVQDGFLGQYVITRTNFFMDGPASMQLLRAAKLSCWELPMPTTFCRRRGRHQGFVDKLWSGCSLYSMLLPPDFSLVKDLSVFLEFANDINTPHYKPRGIVIQRGQLLCGRMRKDICASSGSMLHCLNLEFGSKRAEKFINQMVKLANAVLQVESISIGVDDCKPPPLRNCDDTILSTTTVLERGLQFVNLFGQHHQQYGATELEQLIRQTLDRTRDYSGEEALDYLRRNNDRQLINSNGLYEVVDSGAKGSITNIVQIQSQLGQQIQKCTRMKVKLPQFTQLGQAERSGYVAQSFEHGIDDISYFMHTSAGREGLVDTGSKTGDTGYLQARISKGVKNNVVQSDKTVRNTNNCILSNLYGDDGFDGTALRPVKLAIIQQDDKQLMRTHSCNPSHWVD